MTDTTKPRILSVRLPESLFDRLTAEADRRVVGKALLVRKALEKALDQWEGDTLE